MVSPDLANTSVSLEKGRALVEVIQIRNENETRDECGTCQGTRVQGQGRCVYGNQKVTVTERHELALNTDGKPKPRDFESRQFEDEF